MPSSGSTCSGSLSRGPLSPQRPVYTQYRPIKDRSSAPHSLLDRIGPPGFRSVSPTFNTTYPSTVNDSGRPSQPSMVPRDPPIAPRKSACYVPRQPRPPTPDHAPESEQRVAPPERSQRAHLEERRPVSEYDRWDIRYSREYLSSREGYSSHRPTLPPRPAESTLPPRPSYQSSLRPWRSPPYRRPTTSDRRASDRSSELRLSDTSRQTEASRPSMLPTPPPSAPRGPRADAWPVVRNAAPSIPPLAPRPPIVHSAPLTETRETHRPYQDDRVSVETEVCIKQEVVVKEEIIEIIDPDGGDRHVDEVIAQPLIGTLYESDDRQASVEKQPPSLVRPLPAILPGTLEHDVAEHVPDNTEPHVAERSSLPPTGPCVEQAAQKGGNPFRPVESIEAVELDYKQFKHSFEVLVPAKYDRMSQKAKKAWRMMQLQIASARDESGKPTRLVRCGRVRRKGFRKMKIFWTSIKNEDKEQRLAETGRSRLSGLRKVSSKVAKKGRVSRRSCSTTLSHLESEDDDDDDDDYNSEDAQPADEQPGKHVMPKFAGRAPAYDPSKPFSIRNVPRTSRGCIDTREIDLDDLPNVSSASVPSYIQSHIRPSYAPRYRAWTKSVRVLAERRDWSGQPTRLVKFVGITDGKMILRWAALLDDDDMVDVFASSTRKRRRRASDTSVDVALPSTCPQGPLTESPRRLCTAEEAPGNDNLELSLPKKVARCRRRIIKTPTPTPTPALEPAGKVVAEDLFPADELSRRDALDTAPAAANPRIDEVKLDAETSAAAVPPEPSKGHSSGLQPLESALENALNDIDRWTEMLERHPERRHIIEKQLKRTQEEVFRLDAAITIAKS